jgi:hypothetical protein
MKTGIMLKKEKTGIVNVKNPFPNPLLILKQLKDVP